MLVEMALAATLAQQTTEVVASHRLVEGRLGGCLLTFLGAHPDDVYSGGRPLGSSGSVAVWARADGIPYFSLKVAVLRAGETALSKPDRAYLVYGLRTTSEDQMAAIPAEEPEFLLVAFRLGNSTTGWLESVFASSTLSVGVQLDGGSGAAQLDFVVPEAELMAWGTCVGELIEQARSRIGEEQ